MMTTGRRHAVDEQCWVVHANSIPAAQVPRELQGLNHMPVSAVAFKLRGGRSQNRNMKLGRIEPCSGMNVNLFKLHRGAGRSGTFSQLWLKPVCLLQIIQYASQHYSAPISYLGPVMYVKQLRCLPWIERGKHDAKKGFPVISEGFIMVTQRPCPAHWSNK